MGRLTFAPGHEVLSGSSHGSAPRAMIRGQLLFRNGVSAENPSEIPDGTIKRGTARPIQPGRAAYFDGINDYVHVPLPAAVAYPFTICGWFNLDSVAALQTLFSVCDGADATKYLTVQTQVTTGAIVITRRNTTVISDTFTGSDLTAGAWEHVAVVFTSATEYAVYRDGVLSAARTEQTSVPMDAGFDDVVIGVLRLLTQTQFLDGKAFDVRLYDRVLSDSELASIHDSAKPNGQPERYLYERDLIGHWRLDEGEKKSNNWATMALDSSGKANHGRCFATNSTFPYIGDDVPFAWDNELGFTELTGDTAGPGWSVVWDNIFSPEWIANGSELLATALTNQTWRGETGLYAAKFNNGATGGSANNRVDTGASDVNSPADTVLVMTARVALSRDLATGETVRLIFTGAAGGSAIIIKPRVDDPGSPEDLTKFNDFVGTASAFAALTTTSLWVFPNTNVTGGDLTIYLKDVRLWNTGKAWDVAAPTFLGEWPDVIPAGPIAGHDINGNRLQYEGPGPRNALLKDSFCGNFDGVDDLITIPSNFLYPSGATPRTISGWLYWDATSATSTTFLTTGDPLVTGGMVRLQYTAGDTGIGLDFNGIRRQVDGFIPLQRWFHFTIRVPIGATLCEHVELLIDGELMPMSTAGGGSTALQTVADKPIEIGNTAAPDPMRFAMLRLDIFAASDEYARLFARGIQVGSPAGLWPIAEGDGTTIYDASALGNHGTLSGATLGTFWQQNEPYVHYNLRYGFSRTGGSGPRIPAQTGGVGLAADGSVLTNPAGNWHNGAETRVDFTGGQPEAPWTDPVRIDYTLPTAYEFGDVLPSPGMVKRLSGSNETDFLAFGEEVIVIPPDPPPDPPDTTPDQMTFTDLTDVDVGVSYDSELQTVTGINTAAQITVTGGHFSINGGAFSNIPTFVSLGDTVRLRVLSSSSYETQTTVEINIGGMVADFSVTTQVDPGGGATTPLNSPNWLVEAEDFNYAKVGVEYDATTYQTLFNTAGGETDVTNDTELYAAVASAKASASVKAINLIPGPTYNWTTNLLDGINRTPGDPLVVRTKPGQASQAKLSLVLESKTIRGVAFVDLDVTEGMRILGQNGAISGDILIERCTGWLDLQGGRDSSQTVPGTTLVLPTQPLTNVCVRLCDISDHWIPATGNIQGLFAYNCDGLLLEGNIFDHNGWDDTATRDAADSAGGATSLKHNVYINPCYPAKNSSAVVIRFNWISRACAHGVQGKAGAKVYRNLFVKNPIACQLGYGGDQQFTGFGVRHDSVFRDNLAIDSADIDSGNPRGVFFWTTCVEDVIFYQNLCVDNSTGSVNNETYFLERDYPISITMGSNQSVNWPSQTPLRGAPNYTPVITDLGGNVWSGLSLTSGAQTLADNLKADANIEALKVARARLGVDIAQLKADMATIFAGVV